MYPEGMCGGAASLETNQEGTVPTPGRAEGCQGALWVRPGHAAACAAQQGACPVKQDAGCWPGARPTFKCVAACTEESVLACWTRDPTYPKQDPGPNAGLLVMSA